MTLALPAAAARPSMLRTPDSPSSPPAPGHSALAPAALRRARVHAELTGLAPSQAQQVVDKACRQAGGRTVASARFWRALHVQLAPLAPSTQRLVHPVAAALAALPIEARCAFLLRLGEGFAVEAIARALDEPESRARQHLAQASRELRAQLGPGLDDARWIEGVRTWLDGNPHPLVEPAPAPGEDSRSHGVARSRLLTPWLGLGLALLVLAGAAVWVGTDPRPEAGASLPMPTPLPATGVDPVEQLLSLPPDDFALLGEAADLATIGQLDFLLWRAQTRED